MKQWSVMQMDKKEVIKEIKYLKKWLRNKEGITIPVTSFWDIHEKEYTAKEIAARYLRRKGYPIAIHVTFSDPRRPQYMFGYLRYSRYATIIIVIK